MNITSRFENADPKKGKKQGNSSRLTLAVELGKEFSPEDMAHAYSCCAYAINELCTPILPEKIKYLASGNISDNCKALMAAGEILMNQKKNQQKKV